MNRDFIALYALLPLGMGEVPFSLRSLLCEHGYLAARASTVAGHSTLDFIWRDKPPIGEARGKRQKQCGHVILMSWWLFGLTKYAANLSFRQHNIPVENRFNTVEKFNPWLKNVEFFWIFPVKHFQSSGSCKS